MSHQQSDQLAFPIEGMIHEAEVEAAPEWIGAPLHFTTTYYPPADLDAAFEHWKFLHKLNDAHTRSHMWHRAITVPGEVDAGGHQFDFFSADLRCERWMHDQPHSACQCVGELTYMAICEPHQWHGITSDENTAVEGWHDHAFPGWHKLPIVPARLRDIEKTEITKAARKWIEEHYPPSMQVAGAPIITERSSMGIRHVPGRSPWGGYDISHTAIDPNGKVETRKGRAQNLPPQPTRSTDAPGIGLDR